MTPPRWRRRCSTRRSEETIEHRRTWVALVDGNKHQIDRIGAEAADPKLTVTVIIDLIHVMEYLWASAWSFFDEGDAAAQQWVADKTLAILEGNAGRVAASIECRANSLGLAAGRRTNADKCVTYLRNKRPYLDYPTALARGWPIATGIIEGACRHIVADRLAITGARWSVDGAEAVLKLRAVRANGDFDDYFGYHLQQEQHTVHLSRYADAELPAAA